MEIHVKTQAELDVVPEDFDGTILIEFGTLYDPAIVEKSYNSATVEAWNNSSVVACGNSSVEARDNSSVVARGNSSVVACGNSSVVAWDNSSVVACGNSSVEARDNSSVVARGNVQVVDFLQRATIKLSGNARTVYMPRNIEEFMTFYNIEHDKTTALFYKAVHKRKIATHYADNNEAYSCYEYVSHYDENFKYEIGKKVSSNSFNDDTREPCGCGIHISHKNWTLDYGKDWENLAILELKVKINDILLPRCSGGKVRVPEAEVVREVPLEECGMLGIINLKRRKTK